MILSGVAGALIQRYLLTRRVSTGEPPPAIINKPAEVLTHAVEKAAGVVGHMAHVGHHSSEGTPPHPEASANGAIGETAPEAMRLPQ